MTATMGDLAVTGPVTEPPVRPVRYLVAARCAETSDTVTLMLRPVDHPIQVPRPGQLTMLYAFGVGEVPLSVSGFHGAAGPLVYTIRAVEATTRGPVRRDARRPGRGARAFRHRLGDERR